MAYEHERDEWRTAIRSLTETQRHINRDSRRTNLGITGDPTDNLPEPQPDFDGDDAA